MIDPTQTPDGSRSDGQASGQDYEKMYKELQAQVETGTLVSNEIKKRLDSGELYLKDRFTGLQTSLNKTVEEKKALSESLATNQTTVEALSKQKADLEATAKELNDKLAGMGVNLTAAEKKAARKDLILSQFPALASFESDGLLPDADLEKLPDVLKSFAEKVGAIASVSAQAKAAGGMTTPPASAGTTKRTSKELMTMVQDASLGDTKNGTYDELYQEYLTVKAEESKTK